jgi:hypothetical protein
VRRTAAAFVAVAALAGSLYAAAFSSAAGTRVASPSVKAFNCRIDPVDVAKGVQISVGDSGVEIATGKPSSSEHLVIFNVMGSGYGIGSRCHSISRRVGVTRYDLSPSYAPIVDCAAPAHVLIRLAIRFGLNTHPRSARIQVTQPHAPLKPLAQLVWSTDGSTTYYRHAACTAKS